MAKTLSGLFTGPSAADVRMAMGLESDARIRQAGEDAKAGGFIPSYIAPVSYTHLTLPTTPYV